MSRRAWTWATLVALVFVAVMLLTPSLAHAEDLGRPVIVGIYDNRPLSYLDDSGKWTGVFPDTLEAVADREGWELEFREMTFDQGLELVESNSIDMLLVVADTPRRRETMAFADATFITNWGVISVPRRSRIQGLGDLNGATIAVNTGDVYYEGDDGLRELLSSLHLNATYVEYPSYLDALEAVVDGKADAGLTSRMFAQVSNEDLGLVQSAIMLRPTRLSVALPLDGELTPQLKAGVDELLGQWATETDSPHDRAIQLHVYGEEHGGVPVWMKWAAGGLVATLAVVLVTALLLRAQVAHRTRELSDATGQLRQLIDSIPDTYIRLDAEGRILEARAGTGLPLALTCSASEAVGQLMPDITPPHLRRAVEDNLANAIASGSSTAEYNPFPKEPMVWREMRTLRTSAGELLMLVRDISEAKRLDALEHEYRRTLERDVEERSAEIVVTNARLQNLVDELQATTRARDLFLANVSHELRTPLNSILGFTGIMLQGLAGELNEEQRKQLEMVQRSGRRLAALVEDVLLLEQFNTDQMSVSPEAFSICDSLRQVAGELAPLAAVKELSLVVECPDDLPQTYTDRRLLERVLVNLVGNAVKFTLRGGITLRATVAPDGMLEISVADTGAGIPGEYLETIFDEFTQVPAPQGIKPEGTGLGLPISRRIARRLGGDLTVESNVGEGTTFTIRVAQRYADAAD